MGENVYLVFKTQGAEMDIDGNVRPGHTEYLGCYYESMVSRHIRIRFMGWMKSDPPLGTMKKDDTYILVRVGPDDARATDLIM